MRQFLERGLGQACELKCLMAAMSLCLADARLIEGYTSRAKGRTPLSLSSAPLAPIHILLP